MPRKVFFLLLIFIIILGPVLSFADKAFLLEADFNSSSNPDFKEDAYVISDANFSWSPDQGKDGSGCLVVENKTENDSRYAYTVSAKGNTYYRISVYIKTESVGLGSDTKGANISIKDLSDVYGDISGTQDWTHVEFYGLTDNKQKSFTVFLRLGGYSGVNTGIAYFDDFKIEELDRLPSGEKAQPLFTSSSITSNYPDYYLDSMKVASLILLFSVFLFVLYNKRLKMDQVLEEKSLGLKDKVLILIFVALIVRIVIALAGPQCSIDVNLFQYWAKSAAEHGFSIYAKPNNIDYPPGYIFVLMILGHISNLFGAYGTSLGRLIIKLPAILSDLAIAYFIYKLAKDKLEDKWTYFLVLIWLFNPMVILDSAAWGQVDSFLTLFLIWTFYSLNKERYVLTGCFFGLACMVKPQALFVAPIIFYSIVKGFLKRKGFKERLLPFVYTLSSFLVTYILVALPFWVHMSKKWILDLFFDTADHYDYITVNALNYHFLRGNNWVKDNIKSLFGLSLFWWGMIFIVLISVIVWILQQKNPKVRGTPYLMASLLVFLVVNFGPRMHERYFFPVLAFMLIALIYINNKWLLYIYGLASAANFLIVMEVMTDLTVGGSMDKYRHFNWPELNLFRGTLAALNVGASILLLVFAILYSFGKLNREKDKIWKADTQEEVVVEKINIFTKIKERKLKLEKRRDENA